MAAWVVRRRPEPDRRLERAAAALGLGCLVAVAIDAPALRHVLDADALLEGVVVGLATGVLVWAGGAAVLHQHRAGPTA